MRYFQKRTLASEATLLIKDYGKEYVNRWVWNQNTVNTEDLFGQTYTWDNSDNELVLSCWGQMTAYINDSTTPDALRSLRGGISTFSEWLICGQGPHTTALSPPDEEDSAQFIIYIHIQNLSS